jgi:hypothetical protein
MEPDGVHPNYDGQRVIARAILDALGQRDVPLVEKLDLAPVPGLIREWRIRPEAGGEWSTLVLPQPNPADHPWVEQERQRGFARGLPELVAKAKRFEAVAQVEWPVAGPAILHVGGYVETVNINGEQVFTSEGWRGWHVRPLAKPVQLRRGTNDIRITTGPAFLVALTQLPEAGI